VTLYRSDFDNNLVVISSYSN